jgi:hypothetical protein
MKKLLLASVSSVLGVYAMIAATNPNDPADRDTLAGLTIEEINQGAASLEVASGEDALPTFEEMAVEYHPPIELPLEIMAVEAPIQQEPD